MASVSLMPACTTVLLRRPRPSLLGAPELRQQISPPSRRAACARPRFEAALGPSAVAEAAAAASSSAPKLSFSAPLDLSSVDLSPLDRPSVDLSPLDLSSVDLSRFDASALHNQLALAAELSPDNAALIAVFLGPTLAVVNLLFIFRIVMSWYPQLPVQSLPFSIAFAPTEPLLSVTRRMVPPVGGVDVAPVIWLAFFSFINEILLGQQGLLVLISQQQI